MEKVRLSGSNTSRLLPDELVVGSFLSWSLVFGVGSYLIGLQLAKISGGFEIIGPVQALFVGLVGLILMVGIHFIRSNFLHHDPKYSLKFLAIPLVILALEVVVFWLLAL